MIIREISYYREFACLASACPETCCRGWIIPLEPEDVERMKSQKGLLGLKLFYATGGGLKQNFNSSSATCPFLNRKGLCSMQLSKGHDFLPEACREYPRFFRNYGLWEERYIDLSCIAGAQLWFDQFRDLTFTVEEGDPVSGKDSTNEDEAYLRALDQCRADMVSALLRVTTAEELIRTFTQIDAFAHNLQDAYLHRPDTAIGELSKFPSLLHPLRVAENPVASPDGQNAPLTGDALCKPENTGIFPFGAKTYRTIMKSHLFSERLAVANPGLYDLCKLYYEIGGGKFSKEWPKLAGDFLIRYERYVPYYASLFSYYLLQHFLRTYEDYSFLRNIRTGLIHVNMKFFFDVLLEHTAKSFTDADFVHNLAVYNRRAYFNGQILDEMYASLE